MDKNKAIELAKAEEQRRTAEAVEQRKAEFAERKRKEEEEKALKKEQRLAQMDKIPLMLKLLCCRGNKDGDKIGLLLIEAKEEGDGSGRLNIAFPDKQATPLVSGWIPLTEDNIYLLTAPPLTDVPCLIGKTGNFIVLLKVLNSDTFAQIRDLVS